MGLLDSISSIPLSQVGSIAAGDPLTFFNSLLQNQLKLSAFRSSSQLYPDSTLVIDATETMELSGESDVTSKPVESGARIYDQSTRQPYAVEITGYLNERSSSLFNQPAGVLANYASGLFPAQTATARKSIDLLRRTGKFPLPESRITVLMAKLRRWKDRALIIKLGNTQKLLTRREKGSFLINKLSFTQDTDTGGNAVKANITLTEVRFYSSGSALGKGLGVNASDVKEISSLPTFVKSVFGFR